MSSTTTQIEPERLASEESNGPTEPEGAQNPIVGRSPKSVVLLDHNDVLLVIDIVHKHL